MPNTYYAPFTDTYKEKCFAAWYESGCLSIRKYLEVMPTDESGRKPGLTVLSSWFEEEWWTRKDVLDAKAATQLDDELVATKVNMLKEQAAQFREVRRKAAEYLIEHDFDSSSSAVQALIKSAQEERIVRGISKTIQRLAELGDDELMKEIKQLAERAGVGEVIDMAEVPEEEDAESLD